MHKPIKVHRIASKSDFLTFRDDIETFSCRKKVIQSSSSAIKAARGKGLALLESPSVLIRDHQVTESQNPLQFKFNKVSFCIMIHL